MAPKVKGNDQFAQKICVQAATPNVNGDLVQQIPTAFSPKDRVGLIIHRAEYLYVGTPNDMFASDADRMMFGLSFVSSDPALLQIPQNLGSLDYNYLSYDELISGNAPAAWLTVLVGDHRTTKRDFTSLPGGGLLCHPSAIYFWAYLQLLSNQSVVFNITLHYTTVDLSEELYRELWEMRVTAQTT